jgi:hypothetical protein
MIAAHGIFQIEFRSSHRINNVKEDSEHVLSMLAMRPVCFSFPLLSRFTACVFPKKCVDTTRRLKKRKQSKGGEGSEEEGKRKGKGRGNAGREESAC